MASYVIGDVQGCFLTLERLLRRIGFDAGRDRLWSVGDLVNRGPRSLEVLRWARELGESLTVVLGNHDMHLLARAAGVREAKRRDTLEEVLGAPDASELLEWLGELPLMHRDRERGWVMVHAGIHPSWTLDRAESLAREAEADLRQRPTRVLESLYRDRARSKWNDRLSGRKRSGRVIEILTRLRTVTDDGELCIDYTGPPAGAPAGCRPWFELASIPRSNVLLFGHWSTLGLLMKERFIALDSGCVWGGVLTAVRLEDRQIFQEPFAD